MIKTGDLVKMKPRDYCVSSLKLAPKIISDLYPPERAVCLVVTGIRESDLSNHSRYFNPKNKMIELKKSIQVVFGNKIYGPCDLSAFDPVRK